MKKHELIKHAYDNYPKGIKFKNLATGNECISAGKFIVTDFGIYNDGVNTDYLYSRNKDNHYSGKWARIIPEEKPAETILFEGSSCYVKVDENGFKAIAESDERTFRFSGEELKQIYNAWQEHQPF